MRHNESALSLSLLSTHAELGSKVHHRQSEERERERDRTRPGDNEVYLNANVGLIKQLAFEERRGARRPH